MFSLLLASMSLQASAVPPAPPVPPALDHRFAWDYVPHRQIEATQWWCEGNKHPSTARFEVRYDSTRDASGKSTGVKHEVRLLELTVHGKSASALTVRKMRELTGPLESIGNLRGRCLPKPSGKTAPILYFDGYASGLVETQKVKVELDSM
jgi:hypothetical protein